MSAVREQYVNIVGVDTHARTTTYAILVAASGQVMDTATFPTSPPGLKRAIAWIDRRSLPGEALVAIEGTNSYGSGLTRALRATELDICEVRPPRRISRAGRGKSDVLTELPKPIRDNHRRGRWASARFCSHGQPRECPTGSGRAGGVPVRGAGGHRRTLRTLPAG